MHQTWTSVENCEIVIVFCLHCKRSLHLPCPIVWACNNYLDLLTNWMPSKSFICGGILNLQEYMYVYWPFKYTPKTHLIWGCLNLQELVVHLLVTWMQPKSFICWCMHSKWTKNNTLELPKKFNTQRLIGCHVKKN
jgi:hypothetical protein